MTKSPRSIHFKECTNYVNCKGNLFPKANPSSGPSSGAQMTLSVYSLRAPTVSLAPNLIFPWNNLSKENANIVHITWSRSLLAVPPHFLYFVSPQTLSQLLIRFATDKLSNTFPTFENYFMFLVKMLITIHLIL